ncbi:META domain-containing protein [Tsukamurella soli]|uniref:DUF306 domain-containing protein n=1 Tax=Tsukamurella soli TaxID=644556 RepID=A0ABP8J240_9ACTN
MGTRWRFEASGFARTAPTRYRGALAHITLTQQGTSSGDDGCNGIGGDARVADRHVTPQGATEAWITFGPLISTMMACIRRDAGAQFRQAFDGVRTVTVTGGTLRISGGPRGYRDVVAAPTVPSASSRSSLA